MMPDVTNVTTHDKGDVIMISQLNSLLLPTVVRVIKSRRMRWPGLATRMGEGRGVYRVLVGKSERKRPLGRPSCSGRIILRWIFRMWEVGVWSGLSWLRIETGGGHL
jgi:hypothetical protein